MFKNLAYRNAYFEIKTQGQNKMLLHYIMQNDFEIAKKRNLIYYNDYQILQIDLSFPFWFFYRQLF